MSEITGNPELPNEHTDHLAGVIAALGVDGAPGEVAQLAEQLHQVLLLRGWREPEGDV